MPAETPVRLVNAEERAVRPSLAGGIVPVADSVRNLDRVLGRRPLTHMRTHELTTEQIAEIKRRLARGDLQHEIAADLRINQGRISEINTGKLFADVPAPPDQGSLRFS